MPTDKSTDILEQVEKLSVRTETQFEYIDNQIIPKEDSTPLSPEIIDYILSDDFDLVKFLQTNPFEMSASLNHHLIMSELNRIISQQINFNQYGYFVNGINVSRKYFGGFYVPDICFSLLDTRRFDERGHLENPISIIEILSPSTAKKDRNQKKEAYQSISSLQEYILIAQDSYKIEQFLRQGKTNWIAKVYDSADQTCILTVGVELKLEEAYSKTTWDKKTPRF